MKIQSDKYKLISAFAIVYLVWGSTYLAIKFVVQTLPPMTSAGVRFLVAGLILYGFKRLSGIPKPEIIHWRSSAIAGAIFFLISNGGIMIAIQYVDSGITALLVALCPCWMVIIDRISGKTKKTGWMTITGLALGLFGLMILFNPFKSVTDAGNLNLLAAASIVLCSMSWAFGSVFVREAPLPESRSLSASMQMICGGILMLIAGEFWENGSALILTKFRRSLSGPSSTWSASDPSLPLQPLTGFSRQPLRQRQAPMLM